jgi:hypothetical protein
LRSAYYRIISASTFLGQSNITVPKRGTGVFAPELETLPAGAQKAFDFSCALRAAVQDEHAAQKYFDVLGVVHELALRLQGHGVVAQVEHSEGGHEVPFWRNAPA